MIRKTARAALLPLAFAACGPLMLAACNKDPAPQQDLESLDKALTEQPAAARDPALTASLADQILVDPALAQGSNGNAVRPPPRPDSGATPPVDIASIPDTVDQATLRRAPAATADCPECKAATGALTLGELAGRQRTPGTADCTATVGYSAAWANRLPADLPLYPDARVVEAAGASSNGCRLRVVSFVSSAGVPKVIDWYYTRATGAGYSAGHKAAGAERVLAGTRGRDAYVVFANPRAGGGTEVDLVVNAGS